MGCATSRTCTLAHFLPEVGAYGVAVLAGGAAPGTVRHIHAELPFLTIRTHDAAVVEPSNGAFIARHTPR